MSDNDYSDYSEDFEREKSPTPANYQNKKSHVNGSNGSISDSTSYVSEISYDNKKSFGPSKKDVKDKKKTNTKPGPNTKYRSNSQPYGQSQGKVIQRVVSAKNNRIKSLYNQITEMKIKIDELTKENRTLKTMQQRQDKELKKRDDGEHELPRILAQHNEEQRVVQERLRKSRQKERNLEMKLRATTEEFSKLENALKKLKKIVHEKGLRDRSELTSELDNAKFNLSEADRRNKDLQRNLDLCNQSYNRQIRNEQFKHRETRDSLSRLQADYTTLQAKLKEKERQLEYANIYSRGGKPPQTVMDAYVKQSGGAQVAVPATNGPLINKPAPQPVGDVITKNPIEISRSPALVQKVALFSTEESPPSPSPPPFPSQNKLAVAPSDFRKTIKSPQVLHEAKQFAEPTPPKDSLDISSSRVTVQDESPRRPEATASHVTSFFPTETSPVPPIVSKPKDYSKNTSAFGSGQSGNLPPHHESPFHEFGAIPPPNDDLLKKIDAKKEEEERQRKADLLAKMRELENQDNEGSAATSTTEVKGGDDLLSLLSGPKDGASSHRFDPKVENLHMGRPSHPDVSKDISFGGYAPSSLSVSNKSKSNRSLQSGVTSPPDSSDKPMLDLNSSKQATSKPDLLQTLFGSSSKPSVAVTSPRDSKMPRAKPVHSGYPWEKNVVPVAGRNSQGGTTGVQSSGHKSSTVGGARQNIIVSPFTNPRTTFVSEDDIEELAL